MQKISAVSAPVVTGESAPAEPAPAAEPTKFDKPVIVFVCDIAGGCEGFDKLQEVVFKKENVALGMKAFRTVKMTPGDAEAEPLLQDAGKDVPRLVVIDPVKSKNTVLEKNKLTASSVFGAMKKAAESFYGQDLDKVVKEHLKLLTERDQLSNRMKVITDKKSRLDDDAEKNAKDIAELDKEASEVTKLLEGLVEKERAMWKLSPKAKAA